MFGRGWGPDGGPRMRHRQFIFDRVVPGPRHGMEHEGPPPPPAHGPGGPGGPGGFQRRFISQAELACVRFKGTDVATYLDRRDLY